MTTFTGTSGNDTANISTGVVSGFTNGTLTPAQLLALLQDANGDIFNAGAGNDTVVAGNSGDTFTGLGGVDFFNGNGGTDEVRYDLDAANGGLPGTGVTVNFSMNSATDGFGNAETILNVEVVRGTNFADTLTGGNLANGSGIGNYASDGFEGFRGLGGADVINGGAGYDEVRYDLDAVNGGTAGVTVNLTTGFATDGFGAQDTLSNIEAIRGTASADTFIGNSYDNYFFGLAGADTIAGGDGFDTLRYDQDANFTNSLNVFGTGAVNVNLATGLATDGFGNIDHVSGIEAVRGTAQADTITGSDYVGFQNEIFTGLNGADIISGGRGFDEVRYDQDAGFVGGGGAVLVNLATGSARDGFGPYRH
jgi:hypothetical protein